MRSKVLVGLMFLVSSCLDENTTNPLDQLNKEVKQIDDYLTANPGGPNDIIIKDASGIRLVISELGTGVLPPNPGNNLKVDYTGRLLSDGSIFDSNDSFLFKLSDNIISGWKIGLALITEGTHAKLYIPSYWAYGTSGQSSIPGNATLVFDIHLIDVVPTQQQLDKLEDDVEAIDAYLTTNEIEAELHESGIRYVVTETGIGATPSLYDAVKISYKGKLLTTGSVFADDILEPTTTFSSRVVNYPHGVLLGLQLLPVGSKATFYVPSGLAFGATAYPEIPANSNVIFEIELIEIVE
jgi:FKBP-type peptidyl-prolyl cis-trans isomerase FkpA